jgi:hypothetical protein
MAALYFQSAQQQGHITVEKPIATGQQTAYSLGNSFYQ